MTTHAVLERAQSPAYTRPALSFEIFPAKETSRASALSATLEELASVRPDYVSVTSKPGGCNFAQVCDLIHLLNERGDIKPLVHLTCTAATRASLEETINVILDLGVRGILALRGDYPPGHDPETDELPFARYLVELIREVEGKRIASLAAGSVSIGVAAYAHRHPESSTFQHDIEVLLSKQRSGANFAITQVFWDARDYTNLVERARRAGVTIPLIPGILPTSDPLRLLRIHELTGVPVPRDFLRSLVDAGDSERFRRGVEFSAALMNGCLEAGAPGLHIYTFNKHRDALAALAELDLRR